MGVAPSPPPPPPPRPGVASNADEDDGVEGTPAIAAEGRRPVAVSARDGVAAPRGVAANSSGFGVAATVALGVIPLKSEGCSSGFSPPIKGVSMLLRRARFWASIRIRSTAGAVLVAAVAGV
jgi:hypothetical protein